MTKPKIDLIKLDQMLRAGKQVKECAEFFNVTSPAISMAKKNLNISVVKSVALESAHRVVDKNLDAVAQLQKINKDANELLDVLMRWNRGEDTALQILETQVRKVRVGKGENAEIVKQYKFKDPRELALRAMAEIRGQLNLQLDIFKTLYDMEAVAEFQREVLSAIGEEAPHVRNRIIKRLKEGRSLRSAVSIN